MASIPVTIQGVMTYSGLEVGGGPIIPPEGGPPSVEHPIVLPIPPGGISPGPPPIPTHPIYLPVYPAHPIVIPPDAIAPGVPTHPIYLPPLIWPSPGHPAHPIVLPPGSISPGPPPIPAHPIYLPPTVWPPLNPPTEPPTEPPPEGWTWVYSPVYGWVAQPPGGGGKPQPPAR